MGPHGSIIVFAFALRRDRGHCNATNPTSEQARLRRARACSRRSEHREALERVEFLKDQIELLQQDVADIHRLRAEVDRLAQLRERIDELTGENELLALELERARQSNGQELVQTPAETSFDLTPMSQDYLDRYGDIFAEDATRLFTRTFTVGADGITTLARRTRNATDAENGTELIRSYLNQNGLEFESPEAAALNETTGVIMIRTRLDKFEKIEPLIAPLQDER